MRVALKKSVMNENGWKLLISLATLCVARELVRLCVITMNASFILTISSLLAHLFYQRLDNLCYLSVIALHIFYFHTKFQFKYDKYGNRLQTALIWVAVIKFIAYFLVICHILSCLMFLCILLPTESKIWNCEGGGSHSKTGSKGTKFSSGMFSVTVVWLTIIRKLCLWSYYYFVACSV